LIVLNEVPGVSNPDDTPSASFPGDFSSPGVDLVVELAVP
jgi:hypothetical protein